ncbi:hypothetical protein BD410DRAFT_737528 [Rickenella mellea]|uniref:Phosphatidylglycerol/phosphatidylinositol transfer protein n=1 Tax=Rickenella mellea TaxID=50990 RepID=A0A4Y7QLS3_9AGAM|nr:hypothetical protein BD410DRAFT_737528 [Rickenella mellea]
MMHRLPSLALLALACFPLLALAAPQDQSIISGPIHISDSWTWIDCGDPSDIIELHSIKVTPDPPQPGKNLTVAVTGYVRETIEEGAYADVTVKLGLVKLLQKEFDVCEEARNADASVRCPVDPGEYEVEQTVELPKEIPPAKFTIMVRGYTPEDEPMVCVDIKVDFMKKRPFPKIW